MKAGALLQARLLGELAIVNSRLAGNRIPSHEVRKKVEWVQRRRKNWQLVYDYIVKNDVEVTLEAIESANAKARPGAARARQPTSRQPGALAVVRVQMRFAAAARRR